MTDVKIGAFGEICDVNLFHLISTIQLVVIFNTAMSILIN